VAYWCANVIKKSPHRVAVQACTVLRFNGSISSYCSAPWGGSLDPFLSDSLHRVADTFINYQGGVVIQGVARVAANLLFGLTDLFPIDLGLNKSRFVWVE
jgi:hypothetical protein